MACGATLKRPLEFDPLHSPVSKSPKRRRCAPLSPMQGASPNKLNCTASPFAESSNKMSPEHIAAKLNAEIKRMHRRKQVATGFPPSPPRSMSPNDGSDGPQSRADSPSVFLGNGSPNKKETPLFTFRQMSLICQRLLQEREEQLRELYDKVLATKLAEQYEAFLKFNYDMIQRRLTEKPASYVS